MWPKMLLELLPHLTRLVPMWDKFLSNKAANDKATETAINSLSEQVRNELGQIRTDVDQVTSAQTGLYRQLQDQNAQIATLAEEVKLTRQAAERAESAARMIDPALTIQSHATRRVPLLLTVLIVLAVLSILLQLAFHFAR